MDHNLRKKLRSRASTIFTVVQQIAVMWVELKKKRNTVANNKACPVCSKVCSKVFAQKPNSKRQVKNFYQDSEYDIVIDNQHDKDTQNETKPSMVLAIDTVPP